MTRNANLFASWKNACRDSVPVVRRVLRRDKSTTVMVVTVFNHNADFALRGSERRIHLMRGVRMHKFAVRHAEHVTNERNVNKRRKLPEEHECARQDREHANLQRQHSRSSTFGHWAGGLAPGGWLVKSHLWKVRATIPESV